jgi:hypothetical protein
MGTAIAAAQKVPFTNFMVKLCVWVCLDENGFSIHLGLIRM